VDTPRHCRTAEKQLAKAQRRVSRRQKGSKRRKKAVKVRAKRHQQVRCLRCDFPGKTALLPRRYDEISLSKTSRYAT
jgi:putative transposase